MRRSTPRQSATSSTSPIGSDAPRQKRLGLSDAELNAIAGRIGNSIAAISKEAAPASRQCDAQPADLPPAAVIASPRRQSRCYRNGCRRRAGIATLTSTWGLTWTKRRNRTMP